MQTQEERLSALERSVAILQRRFNDADIESVNHNATMLLGLAYAHQADIREIKAKQEEHTATLEEHTMILNEHTATLKEHTKLLNEHTAILYDHTKLLNEHTTRFDRLEGLLAQVLERLPK